MRNRLASLALIGALLVCLPGVRAEARGDDRSDAAASNAAALRELLEGVKGAEKRGCRRRRWSS
jgi:hypothetical protein